MALFFRFRRSVALFVCPELGADAQLNVVSEKGGVEPRYAQPDPGGLRLAFALMRAARPELVNSLCAAVDQAIAERIAFQEFLERVRPSLDDVLGGRPEQGHTASQTQRPTWWP
jgi:hypothetical protein